MCSLPEEGDRCNTDLKCNKCKNYPLNEVRLLLIQIISSAVVPWCWRTFSCSVYSPFVWWYDAPGYQCYCLHFFQELIAGFSSSICSLYPCGVVDPLHSHLVHNWDPMSCIHLTFAQHAFLLYNHHWFLSDKGSRTWTKSDSESQFLTITNNFLRQYLSLFAKLSWRHKYPLCWHSWHFEMVGI